MIAQLSGTVVQRGAGTVVVDVHGVGYLVHVAGHELLPPAGEAVVLHTSLQVREDAMTLYGFTELASRDLFTQLLGATGVGPKLALAALGTHRAPALRAAIAGEDLTTLMRVPGIGKKVAQRLVLELRDRVGALPTTADDLAAGGGPEQDRGEHAAVRAALAELGYRPAEVARAMEGVDADADRATGLRQALRRVATS